MSKGGGTVVIGCNFLCERLTVTWGKTPEAFEV